MNGDLADLSTTRQRTVYARSRGKLLAANFKYTFLMLSGSVVGLLVLIVGLQELFAGRASGLLYALAGGGLLTFGVWAGRVSVQSFRLERRQVPYFVIDDQGIECARGRFLWEDVSRVVEVVDQHLEIFTHGSDSSWRTLIFVLQDGTTPQPVERAYLDGFDKEAIGAASLTPYGLELTITHCKKQAREALASFGYRTERAERSKLTKSDATVPLPY